MTDPVRPQDLRVSDVERSAVASGLQRAHDAGQLDLTEFDDAGTAMKVLLIIWLCLSLVNFLVWGILESTVGDVHPWFLYVALPPGAVLGVLYAIGIGRPRR